MRRRVAVVAGGVVIAAILAGCHVHEGTAVAENQAILAGLELFPGAIPSRSYSLSDGDGGDTFEHVTGYSTHTTYGVPKGASSRAIVRHYARQLKGEWQGGKITKLGPQGETGHVACFRRGDAYILVFSDRAEHETRNESGYEILVNSQSTSSDTCE